MTSLFRHTDLKLFEPSFSSPITSLIIALDYLRKKKLGGTTHPHIFFQLNHLFHTLESIGSARIEGNNTTIADHIETKIVPPEHLAPAMLEIQNMEQAMDFIDQNVKDIPLNRVFISELHEFAVDKLPPPPEGEGDRTPGMFRIGQVTIAHSSHIPHDALKVDGYME